MDHLVKITLHEDLLSEQVSFLCDTTLFGKFFDSMQQLPNICTWAKKYWKGVKYILFLDYESKKFIVLFETKLHKDVVHRHKGWFCKGSMYVNSFLGSQF